MARRLALILLTLLFYNVHAEISSARQRAWARFRAECDSGNGKACYDYGRARWSTPGAIDHKISLKYLWRGCELKYKLACEAYRDHHDTIRRNARKRRVAGYKESLIGPCYSAGQMKNIKFSTNLGPKHGLHIDQIKPGSFWDHTGLMENDIIYTVNNLPFNTQSQAGTAMRSEGGKFVFQIQRNAEPVTVLYTCD